MLMSHPPQIITRGRQHASQGCFEGLTAGQVPVVVQELVACDAGVQEALADPLEVVQEIAQARPYAFHRVTVHTGTVRVTTRVLAPTMVDRPMVIVSRSEMVDVVFISEELRPGFHRGGNDGCDGRGAHVLEHFQINWRGWRVRVGLVTALHQAQQGGTAHLGSGSTAQLNPTWSRCAFAAFDFTGQPFATCTLVALICFYLVLQVTCRLQMVRLIDAPIQQIDTPLRGPLLDVSGGSNFGGIQL